MLNVTTVIAKVNLRSSKLWHLYERICNWLFSTADRLGCLRNPALRKPRSDQAQPHPGNAGLRARIFAVCSSLRLRKTLDSVCSISATRLPDHWTSSAADWAHISKNFESVLNTRIKRLEQLHWLWMSVVKKLRFVQS